MSPTLKPVDAKPPLGRLDSRLLAAGEQVAFSVIDLDDSCIQLDVARTA